MATINTTPAEIWHTIPGYEDIYEASDCGRIRSTRRRKNTWIGRVLRPCKNRGGYYMVSLRNNGGRKSYLVHRLVAAAFLDPCPPGYEVNHKDSVKLNNHVSNLEWVTRSTNHKHAYAFGRRPNYGPRKFKEIDVRDIRHLLSLGWTQKRIATIFNVHPSTISNIKTGKIWRNI